MSERTDDLTREVERDSVGEVGVEEDFDGDSGIDDVGLDDDFGTDFTDFETDSTVETEQTTDAAETNGGLRGRVDDAVSVPAFALQLLGALVGVFVIGGAIPLGPLSGVVGILVALFGLGVVATGPRYVETAVAGTLVGVLTTVVTSITLSVVSGGLLPVAGGLVGGAAALLGHYLGRDLRDGLTRDL